MNYLVTGGAGYIGSHMVKFLLSKNHDVTVYDNLSTGKKKYIGKAKFLKIDLLNKKRLNDEMSKVKFDAVFHFAGISIVNESEKKPKKYFLNNVVGTKNLVSSMINNNMNKLIFSSSASVYGNPLIKKITEKYRMKPISIYGQNKKDIEIFLKKVGKEKNFKSISFRYFNAAGADKSGKIGEDRKSETHLIPKILRSLKRDKNTVYVYGKNYMTIDGTCVRDYIHVNDIVKAHYLGLKKFKKNKCVLNYNIGTGKGFSVLEVIKCIEKVTKKKVNIIYKSKRFGDPPILVADCKKIFNELNWKPRFKNLTQILKTAWNWHKRI